MKSILRSCALSAAAALVLLFSSCQKESTNPSDDSGTTTSAYAMREADPSKKLARCSNSNPYGINSLCTSPYAIKLELKLMNTDSSYTWIWSVRNTRPGNGYCGTAQALDHWDLRLNNCDSLNGPTQSDIMCAGYTRNGRCWYFVPTTLQNDATLNTWGNLNAGSVLKFNAGTCGSDKIYYGIRVSRNFRVSMDAKSFYRSVGSVTKAGMQCFPGMGCPPAPPVVTPTPTPDPTPIPDGGEEVGGDDNLPVPEG